MFPPCSNFRSFRSFRKGSGRKRISDRPPIQVKRRVKSGELPAESSYATAAKLRANEVFVRCFDLHDWPGALRLNCSKFSNRSICRQLASTKTTPNGVELVRPEGAS